jgi:hypothetical protein
MNGDDRLTSAGGTLMRIRAAYDDAGRSQPDYYPMLPAWEALPIELREAIIHVYHQGKLDAQREAKP